MVDAQTQLLHRESLKRSDSSQSFSKKIGIAIALIGSVVILDWIFDLAILKSVWPEWVATKVNTAIGLILGGASLRLWQANQQLQSDVCESQRVEGQVRLLNLELERRLNERTAQLQQSIDFEALLKRIADKVRDSLDESQILQTAVNELGLGLGVECDTALYSADASTSTIFCEFVVSIDYSNLSNWAILGSMIF